MVTSSHSFPEGKSMPVNTNKKSVRPLHRCVVSYIDNAALLCARGKQVPQPDVTSVVITAQ